MRPSAVPFILALAASSFAAQVSQYPSPPPNKPGSAIILGRVVEAGTSVGVAGAMVTLYGPPMPGIPGAYIGMPPGGPRRISTDSQGHFLFRDLPPASYSMTATATGYVPGGYGESRIVQLRRTLDLTRTVDITAGDRTVPVSIQMWRNGGLGGRVVDDAGEPMVGIPVSVFSRVTDWGGPITQLADTVMTDDRGMYHKDVTPGDYVVGVLAATTTVPASAVQGFLQAQTEGGATFEKYMADLTAQGGLLPRGVGARVGNLMVSQLATRNTQFLPPVESDGSGVRFFPSVYHPSSLLMSTAAVVSVRSGEEMSGIDIQMRPMAARRVSGRITSGAAPVAGIALRLVAQDPTVARTSPATLIDTPQAMADGNGEFVFVGVVPGSYNLVAIRAPFSPSEPTSWTTDVVTVGDRDIAGLHVQTQAGTTISGRIVTEGTGASPPLDNLRSALIAARPVPGSAGAFQIRQLAARTDQSLRFVIPGLIPGPYMMSVTNLPSGWVLKSVTSNGQNIVDRPFTIGASGLTDIIVSITNQVTSIYGIVRDVDGKTSSSPTVAVFPQDKTLWRLPGMSSRRVQTAAPSRDGRYAFRSLPAGDYYVVAVDSSAADFSDSNVLNALISFAQRVTLGEGESRTQDLRMTVMR
jgi:hypothetical protein